MPNFINSEEYKIWLRVAAAPNAATAGAAASVVAAAAWRLTTTNVGLVIANPTSGEVQLN